MKTAFCLYCKKEFKPRHATKKYCSRDCWRKAIAPKKKRCPICKKFFKPLRHDQKMCSKECQTEAKRNGYYANKKCLRCGSREMFTTKYCRECWLDRKATHGSFIVICYVCGKRRLSTANIKKADRHKYTCRACSLELRKGRRKPVDASRFALCPVCGHAFDAGPSRQKVHCSSPCSLAASFDRYNHVVCSDCGKELNAKTRTHKSTAQNVCDDCMYVRRRRYKRKPLKTHNKRYCGLKPCSG
jgi:hypothetical protein